MHLEKLGEKLKKGLESLALLAPDHAILKKLEITNLTTGDTLTNRKFEDLLRETNKDPFCRVKCGASLGRKLQVNLKFSHIVEDGKGKHQFLSLDMAQNSDDLNVVPRTMLTHLSTLNHSYEENNVLIYTLFFQSPLQNEG
ncbi:hypothetical protein TNIN_77731 [Trichonephila inaurata madagascariensis]|uniref:Uncharacterized protein n=1 Tax=Trichonephila inaurata madagascariensis TaxID=2747483 RepID=A0A8X7BMZ2_9ARAC|nr:hypothetical protein TNIN_77731 [Trichonephila inaurata madagascariensis]